MKPSLARSLARTSFTIAVFLATGLATRSVHADADTVLLLNQLEPAPLISDAARRIGGELSLRGFAVARSSLDATPAGACLLLTEATEQAVALGGLLLLSGTREDAVFLVSYDRRAGTCVSHSVTLAAQADDASLVALRAVEMLRAHFLELRFAERAQHKEPAQVVHAAPTAKAGPSPPGNDESFSWSAGVGAQLVAANRSIDGALAPLLTVAMAKHPWGVELRVAPSSTPLEDSWQTASANTTIRSLAALALRSFRPHARLSPFVGAGVGLVWLAFDAQAQTPDVALPRTLITPTLDASMGLRVRMNSNVFMAFALGMQAWRSTPVLQIKSAEQRRFHNPVIVASVTLNWGAR